MDLKDYFDGDCEDPEEEISARVHDLIDKEIEQVVNQAISYCIQEAMCNMINL